MIRARKSEERGHFDHGWLNTYHTFSFDQYYDPAHMGFHALRVINEDRVKPKRGFPTHGHRDMEIITYVLEGALEHKDSMGNGSIIRPGEVQRMSAGTGVTHSEYNHSAEHPVHFLQIWILPERRGIQPEYEQKHFPQEDSQGKLRLIASGDGRDGSITIHQDVNVYSGLLALDDEIAYRAPAGRATWLQVARGSIQANGQLFRHGDGAAATDEQTLRIVGTERTEFLLFDLA